MLILGSEQRADEFMKELGISSSGTVSQERLREWENAQKLKSVTNKKLEVSFELRLIRLTLFNDIENEKSSSSDRVQPIFQVEIERTALFIERRSFDTTIKFELFQLAVESAQNKQYGRRYPVTLVKTTRPLRHLDSEYFVKVSVHSIDSDSPLLKQSAGSELVPIVSLSNPICYLCI